MTNEELGFVEGQSMDWLRYRGAVKRVLSSLTLR